MNAVHIQQLRFSGREIQRRVLLSDLERAAWPTVPAPAYLFIRRLYASQAVNRLAQKLAAEADACRQTAVSGWLPNAGEANAVYFASEAELLACLSRDLLRGQKHWYWREWADWFAQPIATGLFNCWYQQQAVLPAMVAQLARRDELAVLWRRLPETLFDRLSRAFAPQADWLDGELPVLEDVAGFAVPMHWLSIWRPVFAPASDRPLASRQLAALIVLRQWQPLQLVGADALPVFRALVAALTFSDAQRTTLAYSADKKTAAVADILPAHTAVPASADSPPAGPTISGAHLAASLANSAANGHTLEVERAAAMPADQTPVETSRAEPADGSTDQVLEPMASADALREIAAGSHFPIHCQSAQAGVFYLLNFLNLPPVRQNLLNDAGSRDFPSAWGWLYRLADAMGWQPEPALLQWFAFFCGFEQQDQLHTLPALPRLDELLHLGRQRYGDELFACGLFAVDAMIEIDVSHIDVYFDPGAVRLDIRRAGLDIDPGWLPWLGKVVKFHYQPWAGG